MRPRKPCQPPAPRFRPISRWPRVKEEISKNTCLKGFEPGTSRLRSGTIHHCTTSLFVFELWKLSIYSVYRNRNLPLHVSSPPLAIHTHRPPLLRWRIPPHRQRRGGGIPHLLHCCGGSHPRLRCHCSTPLLCSSVAPLLCSHPASATLLCSSGATHTSGCVCLVPYPARHPEAPAPRPLLP
jgi:hypothetical protein